MFACRPQRGPVGVDEHRSMCEVDEHRSKSRPFDGGPCMFICPTCSASARARILVFLQKLKEHKIPDVLMYKIPGSARGSLSGVLFRKSEHGHSRKEFGPMLVYFAHGPMLVYPNWAPLGPARERTVKNTSELYKVGSGRHLRHDGRARRCPQACQSDKLRILISQMSG